MTQNSTPLVMADINQYREDYANYWRVLLRRNKISNPR